MQNRALQQVWDGPPSPARARSSPRPHPTWHGVWPGAADEEDDFSSFGLPAGSPTADASASLAATDAAVADDDDEFSEFGVPAYPAVASSLPAVDDDDDEFAEALKHHTHTVPTPPPP